MKQRIAELQRQIDDADHAYHTQGQSLVEDTLYDQWKEELGRLNPDDPRLKKVGAAVQESLRQKREHAIPMGSLFKALNRAEFDKWVRSLGVEEPQLHASYKMDGASVSFQFREGRLVAAVSRGDGIIGEDITANALKFRGIPEVVNRPGGGAYTGYMRGEIMLTTEDWMSQVDPDQLSNPRNYCVGIARRQNGHQSELLNVFAFRVFDSQGEALCHTEAEQSQLMAEMEFQCAPSFSGTSEQVWQWYLQVQKDRPELPYWIDGVVVKLNHIPTQAAMGESDQRPKGQIAIKFEAEGASTILRSVKISTGHTGAIVPTAIFDAVQIGGATITSATLCNWENIRALNVGIGDTIRVIKAGDIIPRIEKLIQKATGSKELKAPSACPACQGEVGRRVNLSGEESTAYYCLNSNCCGKAFGKIERFVDSLNISDIGENLIGALIKDMGVTDAADLYRLKDQRDRLAGLKLSGGSRLGEKRADRVLAELEKRRSLTLDEFLGSIGIFWLGKRRVQQIQEAVPGEFDRLEDWLSDKLSRMAAQAGVPNIGKRIQEELKAQELLINKFLEFGVQIVQPIKRGTEHKGFHFSITGTLSRPKSHFESAIREKGHDYTDTFNKEVTHLIAADPNSGSSKLQKAKKNGIEVISEQQLMELLNKS